ncbi:hypothetical protein ABK249_20780 [Neorhizobium sp. Rsf11]|uniref:Uncharacterized protein n=1 Tax=Neorhizobium phenanthreniclasticum TaxID=3157917 RepID=A0ABV0M663_9HYPH
MSDKVKPFSDKTFCSQSIPPNIGAVNLAASLPRNAYDMVKRNLVGCRIAEEAASQAIFG